VTPAGISCFIARHGQDVTLVRDAVAVTVPAVLHRFSPSGIEGRTQQGERTARLAAAALAAAGFPVPPAEGDRLVAGDEDLRVMVVQAEFLGADPALYLLTVEG
jgi:hypothetical protein